MGTSRGAFIKYPRTPHLFGSEGTADDKHLGEEDSQEFIADDSLIVEEKIDGTNIGIHFNDECEMVLQCRGHLISEGMHPQYDLFKQWAAVKRHQLEDRFENRYILFGEWVYAKHSIFYRQLTHYFFEFDIYDKDEQAFLDLQSRMDLLDGLGVETVPVVHNTGPIARADLGELITRSEFDSQFESLFADYNARIEIVYLEPSFDQLAKQNRDRVNAVPDRVLRKMAANCEPPIMPECHRLTLAESFVG